MNLKQKLSKKLKKTGGFTLIEMLIVVAIIAILVAVSIPMVNSSLEKAREATDAANERAAKAAALATFMLKSPAPTNTVTYYYKEDGTIQEGGTAPTAGTTEGFAYGQGTSAGNVKKDRAGQYVIVEVTVDGVATVKWSNDT